jgi:hypothetical protein
MADEEESPFAFHEGGSRDEGVPRNRFNRRGEGIMRKTFSQENNENDEVA